MKEKYAVCSFLLLHFYPAFFFDLSCFKKSFYSKCKETSFNDLLSFLEEETEGTAASPRGSQDN